MRAYEDNEDKTLQTGDVNGMIPMFANVKANAIVASGAYTLWKKM